MENKNILYRVYDKKDRYHQSYSPKLKGSKSWAVDCAYLIKGYVNEDILDANGDTQKSQKIFQFENKIEDSKNKV